MTERDCLPVSMPRRTSTSPVSAPWAAPASTPAPAYAPRSATRPFKPMQATQRERTQPGAVARDGLPGTAQKTQERSGGKGRRESRRGTGGERSPKVPVQPALGQPNRLESDGTADD